VISEGSSCMVRLRIKRSGEAVNSQKPLTELMERVKKLVPKMEVLEPEKRIVAADGIHSQLNNM